ncbi:MAG TPA: hypothetical protein VMY37_05445 [Thermoguttaceae bacterium]|nr:hypothetical protein [Thermoguttaceae bacterium]
MSPHATRLTRRRFLGNSALVGLASALAAPAVAKTTDRSFPFRVGTGVEEITPLLGVGILMSSGRQAWEPFEGVRLPLHAKAVVIEKGERRIALVSLDLIGLAGEAVGGMAGFRAQVAEAAEGAVRADDLVLASTHTHSGPESIALSELYHTEDFRKWSSQLAQRIGSAVRKAAGSVRPVRLATGSCPAPGLAVNRRIKTTRGIASVRRELPPDVVIGPEGPIDDEVRVCALVDGSNEPVAILVNFTAHPVLEMCIKQVSPDYPGEMGLELEKRHPGATVLFFQGACGNINTPTVSRGAASAREYGHKLAAFVEEALGGLQPIGGDELSLSWKTLRLPARTVTGEPQAEPLETRIGAARIGDAAFVFLPGEPFVEIGLGIRAASPCKFTAVVGYADDYIGYIPTDRAFANGGYEIGPGRWSRLASGSESIVRQAAIELLGSLAGAP